MALESCRECGKEVSTEANRCPHCGVLDPSPSAHRRMTWGVVIGTLILFPFIMRYCFGGG